VSESRIIVGVDNSDNSLLAVRWAADEAARTGRDLVVTSAYNSSPIGAGLYPAGEPIDELSQIANETVTLAIADVAIQTPDVNTHGRTVAGPPGPVLTACGPQDLLVVGNRGRGGFASLVLGSVGHYVVTHARATVVVVRGHSYRTEGPVVAGVNPGSADAVLRQAFEEAEFRGARLRTVHAYPAIESRAWLPRARAVSRGRAPQRDAPEFGPGQSVGTPTERHAANHAALADVVHTWAAKFPHVPVDIVAVEGHPTAVLASASAMAQLVVVGHRRSGLGPVGLGAVAAQLLHHAACPLMIVRTSVS
jgi:nucleotide-binding universal stress UspA family protein